MTPKLTVVRRPPRGLTSLEDGSAGGRMTPELTVVRRRPRGLTSLEPTLREAA